MDEATLSRVIIDQEAQWLRVRDNVSKAINDAMEARLFTMPGGKDGAAAKTMRKELEARLAKLQDKMFDMSKYNLQVNGQNYEDFQDVTEGWDEVLDRKTKALHVEKVDWESKNANKRKAIPEGIYNVEADLEARRVQGEWLPEDEEENDDGPEKKKRAEDIPPPERHEDVKQTFGTVISNLAEVARTAPTQLQRAQRAQIVREEITNLPP